MTNDAYPLLGRITAEGTSSVVNQLPLWHQEIQAASAVATTIGVLIALYVATIREPRKAVDDRRHHKAQMDALRGAQRKRVSAQARCPDVAPRPKVMTSLNLRRTSIAVLDRAMANADLSARIAPI